MYKNLSVFVCAVAAVGIFLAGTASVSAQQTTVSATAIARDLSIGSTGSDVASLQAFLQAKGHLVMPAGVAYGTFGSLTQAAVARFQAANGISPAAGYFGLLTRTAYNIQVGTMTPGSGPVPPGTIPCPAGFTPTVYNGMNACIKQTVTVGSTTTPVNNNDDDELEGEEASLENFSASEGSDTDLEEGDNDAEIMDIEFDVEDSDIAIERVDVHFTFMGGDNADDEPWEVFENVYLLIDGDEVAEIDASDEDEWSEEDDDEYRLRFENINTNYVIREGDTAELTLVVDVANSVNGSEDGDASWDVFIPDDGIRVVDAEDNQHEIGDDSEEVSITIDVENGNNNNNNDDDDDNDSDIELSIDDSNDNPEETDLEVYEDDESPFYTVFAFELSADGEDIELTELPITIEFRDNGSFDDVIDDMEISIDGDEYNDYSVADEDDDVTVVTFTFDEGDVEIDENDTVTVEVMIKFKDANDYDDGDEIELYVDEDNAINIRAFADGVELNDDQIDGEAESEVHTLTVVE